MSMVLISDVPVAPARYLLVELADDLGTEQPLELQQDISGVTRLNDSLGGKGNVQVCPL